MHVQFLCIKIKIKKFGKFSNFEKKLVFTEKIPFFRWPGKIQFSIFFQPNFVFCLEDVKNYLNIIFYEKNLKIGFFLAKKRHAKKGLSVRKVALFQMARKKSNYQFFATKICRSFENILNYPNINFCEKILKIGFFLAKKLDRHLQWR